MFCGVSEKIRQALSPWGGGSARGQLPSLFPSTPDSDVLRTAALHCCAGALFPLAGFKVGEQGSVSWRMSLEIKLDSETSTSELDASPSSLVTTIAWPYENRHRPETPPASRLGKHTGPLLPCPAPSCLFVRKSAEFTFSVSLSFGGAGRAAGAPSQPTSLRHWELPSPAVGRTRVFLAQTEGAPSQGRKDPASPEPHN